MNNSFDDEVNVVKDELQDKLFVYVQKYDTREITIQELKEFCKLLVKYCKVTRYNNCTLNTPSVKFTKLKQKTYANYTREINSIKIDKHYLDRILNRELSLKDLVDSIGHEMEHYNQHSSMFDYDNMSAAEQQLVDSKAKESINSYKNYFRLEDKDVKILHDLLAPYLKENEIPSGYETLEDFYADISFASYFTILSEKEARENGVSFAVDFYTELLKSDRYQISLDMLSDKERWFYELIISDGKDIEISKIYKSAYLYAINKADQKKYKELLDKFIKFSQTYSTDNETILKIVESVESENDKLKDIDYVAYKQALKFLVKNRNIEQRKSLLKNAIFNGYTLFEETLIDVLQKDIDFKSNQEDISPFVRDCLICKEYPDVDKNKLLEKIYTVNYANILKQEDFEYVVINLLKENAGIAEDMINFQKFEQFSVKAILECQNIILQSNNEDAWWVLDIIFCRITFENKIEILKSDKLASQAKNFLIESIKDDEQYEQFKDEIEPILENFTDTQALSC